MSSSTREAVALPGTPAQRPPRSQPQPPLDHQGHPPRSQRQPRQALLLEAMAEECVEDTLINTKYRLCQAYLMTVATQLPGDFSMLEAQGHYMQHLTQPNPLDDSAVCREELVLAMNAKNIVIDERMQMTLAKTEEYLDSNFYQREALKFTCEYLNIDFKGQEDTIYRIAGMLLSATLTFWQVLDIAAMVDFYRQRKDWSRGCVLEDVVGLGKTWQIAGFLLTVSKGPILPRGSSLQKPSGYCNCPVASACQRLRVTVPASKLIAIWLTRSSIIVSGPA